MGQADSRALNCNEKVFEKKAKYGTGRVIYLEDLVEADDTHPQTHIERATINLRFYEWAKRTRDEFERDYRRAIANLQKAAPKLKELRIEACYAHKPKMEKLESVCKVEKEAKQMFESEARLLQNRLEGLMYAWKGCPIMLYRVEFHVHWIVDQKCISSADFEKIGTQAFGPKVKLKIEEPNQVQWQYYWEYTEILLTFHFLNQNEHRRLAHGRCSWPKCV